MSEQHNKLTPAERFGKESILDFAIQSGLLTKGSTVKNITQEIINKFNDHYDHPISGHVGDIPKPGIKS